MTLAIQPLVSIVTPMYNEADYISECIDSILSQTYQNWEYIIVDNRSTDESAAIARRFVQRDHRIRLVENRAFLRAVANYNLSLSHISAASKYCKVVLADDWIFPECLERMVAIPEANRSVGIVGAYGLDGSNVLWSGLPYPSTVISGKQACRRLFLGGPYVFGTATALLYRADLVRSRTPFYNEDNIHSDKEVCIDLLRHCDFGFVHQVLTFTRVRPHSLLMMSRSLNSIMAGELHDLVKYGPDFLTGSELDACLRRSLREYYIYLAGSLLRGRDETFWAYHTRTLREAGVPLSRVRLARAVLARLFGVVTNPKSALEILLRARPDESQTLAREVGEQWRESH
jgi:glycosyltransferase involved in cell wall biosynthesis